jgi:UDP-galactopyranose mutase
VPTARYLIVGSGFAGAVLARELAEQTPAKILVVDERPHPAGNCHTARDAATGVMVHQYGPHTFHTDRLDVWQYVHRFGELLPFLNRIKAVTARGVFSLPINLHTINQFFGKTFSPAEARAFIHEQTADAPAIPANFEEQAISRIGRALYEEFFHGYTMKHWGCDPKELPASIFQRLPVRFDYDDVYYGSRYQGIPRDGYTAIVEAMLDHPRIELRLRERFVPADGEGFDHCFYTGPIDGYFGYSQGRLGYRTVTFERIDAVGDFQGNAIINYPELAVPFTRIHEHKHFAPWELHERTVAFREYARETGPADLPFYPKRLVRDKQLLMVYRGLAKARAGVSFLGRLGTYRYLDMDQVIGQALDFSAAVCASLAAGAPIPVFPDDRI